jgi:putative Mn2+ efflux pump MntP
MVFEGFLWSRHRDVIVQSLSATALLLSVDSFLVSFALGACRAERRQQNRLAAAFAVCDAAASLVVLLLGASFSSALAYFGEGAGPALLGFYAVITLIVARLGGAVAGSGWRYGKQLLYLLPPVMSLDNLAGSCALLHAGAPLVCAAVIGSVSGLASICGFRTGDLASTALQRLWSTRAIPWLGRYGDGLVLLSAAGLLAIC